ncbi:amino acid permease [Sulfodiicoccus acidiphilus]|uniref:Amino acid permease n=1 Tax=Sulfodiicoccus acidiphilus TaxID=1670455 RepID=A0A348B2J7_9CREN|nr:APC family permease [Sulfodiicoccus acidiphilus]BBD72399.1 amino acid permease [Sulfodiicoccus acidiphilus]GGT97407.1 amino acid permease [Sulfodiicoccus acidiphilus]
MERSKLFVRESSGLVKDVSMVDAVMLNVGNMSAGLALFTSISPYIQQGSVLWLASLIGFVLALPQAFIYTVLSKRIPRTGGDYVWISRTLGGGIGTVMALAVMIESLAYFAITAYFASSALNTVFWTIGTLDKSTSLLYLANNVIVNPFAVTPTLGQSMIIYGVSAAIFGVIIGLNIVKAKWGYSIVTALGTFSIASTIGAIIVIAASAGHFSSSILPLVNAIKATGVTVQPYTGPSFSFVATLLMLPFFALFTYPWMQAGPAVASEFKGKRTLKYNVIISLVLTALVVTGSFLLMDVVAGYGFNASLYPTGIYNFWTAAITLAGNPVVQWFLGLGLFAWEVYILAYGVIVFSRYVFAMSFDRVLPERFSQVNSKGSPVYAHLLDLAVTLFFLAIPVLSTQGAVALYGATILGSLYFLVVSIAAVFYGRKNGHSGLKIAGVLSAIYFLFLTIEAGVNPAFGFFTGTSVNPITALFVSVTLVGSLAVYLYARFSNAKKGIDLSLVYKEIPPE